MAKPFRTFVAFLRSVLANFAGGALVTAVASESLGEVCCSYLVGVGEADGVVDIPPVFSAAASVGVRLRLLRIDGRPMLYVLLRVNVALVFPEAVYGLEPGAGSSNSRSGLGTSITTFESDMN